ncbi:hypothetical protein [Amycolatopsis pithecellobii]|uniref:Lipoprotein n=1 Tax=Amycolatopsis pithecellobii TaxID=664692 RepID=A0A6N7YV62_9PSEU|nr:hypothetical protein [Amycolatopsis pithecellobii]MTD55832.1 hypothetical protein [Amycolatopsis pithecellobii]
MTERHSLARRVTALFGALAVASLAACGIAAATTSPDHSSGSTVAECGCVVMPIAQ